MLSALLFVMWLGAVSIEMRSRYSWELFYADDLALVSVSLESLKGKLGIWKESLEPKGLDLQLQKGRKVWGKKQFVL